MDRKNNITRVTPVLGWSGTTPAGRSNCVCDQHEFEQYSMTQVTRKLQMLAETTGGRAFFPFQVAD